MVQTHRIKTLAVVGCTAVGKSDTAIKLAKHFNGVIIGADSMQIYRGFDIGTGKLMPDEQNGIEHKMIDIVDGDEEFSVGEYVKLAAKEIENAAKHNKLPIIVGGTGLYVQSLFSGHNFADVPKNADLRFALKTLAHFFGKNVMYSMLLNVDKSAADKISVNDVKRVIRALEIFAVKGKPKSDVIVNEKPYNDLTIVLTLPRETLYKRIDARVKKMFDSGLIDEVRSLVRYKGCQSMQALGYKQIIENPDMSNAELSELISRKTRNYAKRQMTYFNNVDLNKVFIDVDDYVSVEKAAEEFLRT